MIACGPMTARRLSIPATISCLLAAIALWVSLGALTAISDRTAAARAAFVPSPLWLGVFVVAGLALSLLPLFRRREMWLLCLSALVLLPWLPLPVPRAFLVWTGPLRGWLWRSAYGADLAPPPRSPRRVRRYAARAERYV